MSTDTPVGKLVLVVDDEPEILGLIADILAALGHRVMGIASPMRPEQFVFRGPPDLAILDVMLQGFSGIELASQLRAAGLTGPFLGISASSLMAEAARASGEFVAVLDKPFDLDHFLATVRGLLDAKDGHAH